MNSPKLAQYNDLPVLDFYFHNRGGARQVISRIDVEVSSAEIDTTPVLEYSLECRYGDLALAVHNYGWGPAIGFTGEIGLSPLGRPLRDPSVNIDVGTIGAARLQTVGTKDSRADSGSAIEEFLESLKNELTTNGSYSMPTLPGGHVRVPRQAGCSEELQSFIEELIGDTSGQAALIPIIEHNKVRRSGVARDVRLSLSKVLQSRLEPGDKHPHSAKTRRHDYASNFIRYIKTRQGVREDAEEYMFVGVPRGGVETLPCNFSYVSKDGQTFSESVDVGRIERGKYSTAKIFFCKGKFRYVTFSECKLYHLDLPSAGYHYVLDPEAGPRTYSEPAHNSIGPDETDRILLVIASTKSGIFDIRCRFYSGESVIVESDPIRLNVWCPSNGMTNTAKARKLDISDDESRHIARGLVPFDLAEQRRRASRVWGY